MGTQMLGSEHPIACSQVPESPEEGWTEWAAAIRKASC